jgi:hypothetical protein
MVVFCEAVATLSVVDLHNLRDFVASLEPTSGVSQAAARLHELCAAFYEVAKVYLEDFSASTLGVDLSGTTNAPLVSGPPQQPLGPSNNDFVGPNGIQVPLEKFPPGFEGTNMLDLNSYMTWPTEDWFLPDQYMMGILDSDPSRN